jgi:4-hydroxybenzoyl-CoA reductase subunit beta
MIAEKLYIKPAAIREAIDAAYGHLEDFCFIAGGTDALVNKFQGNNESACLIDITGLEQLKHIIVEDGSLKIGSLVKLDELKNHEIIVKKFPALITAAEEVGSPLLRKMATLGGNILCENRCIYYNQSEWWREAVGYCLKCGGDICIASGGKNACFSRFASDTAPVLISAGASLEIYDKKEVSIVSLESIYTGDGIKHHNIPKTSIITNIILPLNENLKIIFRKLRPREAVDFTSLTTAVSLDAAGTLKIVVGGLDPKPAVVVGVLNGDYESYIKLALKKSRPLDNDYYSRKYRREMLRVYLEQSFEELCKLT